MFGRRVSREECKGVGVVDELSCGENWRYECVKHKSLSLSVQ